jgi:hypothetical protein
VLAYKEKRGLWHWAHGRKDPLNIEVIDFSKEDAVQAVFDKVPGGMLLPL